MEIGNLVFGISRGNFHVPRDVREGMIYDLYLSFNEYTYIDFDNEVFEIHPYYWGDCTCGFDDDVDKWENEHKHSFECVHTKYEEFQYPGGEYAERDDNALMDFARSVGMDSWEGCATWCSCGHSQEWAEWNSSNSHKPNCPIIRPNFHYKKTGYTLMWYKYPLRDAYANIDLTVDEFATMIKDCKASIKKPDADVEVSR